jgi:hypothetical protein
MTATQKEIDMLNPTQQRPDRLPLPTGFPCTYIATICHEANSVYCRSIGDLSQPRWEDAPQWQKDSALAGVMAIITNPDQTPEMSHDGWVKQKRADGWVFGNVKNPELKIHPCLVEYSELSQEQEIKDIIFTSVTKGMLLHFSVPLVKGNQSQAT